ncbi:MAG: hypothetical protein IPP79_19115 [Chitinophagaceae bacterium]|nr:hypothetical protein [Chitinophagaceae bacterium]
MKQIILLLAFGLVWLANPISAQTTNVGIGTTNPAEKLDVNGNINLNGTIKVNGQDGQAGQVLMKNSSGQLSWGSISEFKNFRVFTFTFPSATQTFSIPAGVTRMGVEIWSGGGGGAAGGGGGSGGYAYRILDVSGGGSLSIIVGGGGQGAFLQRLQLLVDFLNSHMVLTILLSQAETALLPVSLVLVVLCSLIPAIWIYLVNKVKLDERTSFHINNTVLLSLYYIRDMETVD